MSEKEILEGNKLIAEFMGARNLSNVKRGERSAPYFRWLVHGEEWADEGLKYDKNWNWLMPVVEKIESLRNNNDGGIHMEVIMYSHIIFIEYTDDRSIYSYKEDHHRSDSVPKIEMVFKALVEFIEWYNAKSRFGSHPR